MRYMLLAVWLMACDNREEDRKREAQRVALEQAEAARRAQAAKEDEQRSRALEAEADAAMTARAKKIRHPFPALPNGLIDCVKKKGGPGPLTDKWYAGTAIDVAFSARLGGDLLAQRFANYASALSECTAYSSSTIKRAILPALDAIADFKSMSTLVAAAGDICAMNAETGDECLVEKARALAMLGR